MIRTELNSRQQPACCIGIHRGTLPACTLYFTLPLRNATHTLPPLLFQVILPVGLHFYECPCQLSKTLRTELPFCAQFDYLPAGGHSHAPACPDQDGHCWIYARALDGSMGWLPTGLPDVPGECGSGAAADGTVKGKAYVAIDAADAGLLPVCL